MARLPAVTMSPQGRPRTTFSWVSTYSARTRDQSHSISSATSIARAVKLPWPISDRAIRMIVVSSGSITTQIVTSAAASTPVRRPVTREAASNGAPITKPPIAALIPKAKARRLSEGA